MFSSYYTHEQNFVAKTFQKFYYFLGTAISLFNKNKVLITLLFKTAFAEKKTGRISLSDLCLIFFFLQKQIYIVLKHDVTKRLRMLQKKEFFFFIYNKN